MIACVLSRHEAILVITGDSAKFDHARLVASLVSAGLADGATAHERFVLRGCERISGFNDPSKPIDLMQAQAGLCDLAKEAIAHGQKSRRPIGAVLLESAMLPAFSDVLRAALPPPVFDNFTMADFAYKASVDNPRFGISFGPKSKPYRDLDTSRLPPIGILRIDYTYPPALGDAAHPNSYYYRTPHATIVGLTFEAAQAGAPLTPQQREAMAKAIAKLEGENVLGIAGDCGFMM